MEKGYYNLKYISEQADDLTAKINTLNGKFPYIEKRTFNTSFPATSAHGYANPTFNVTAMSNYTPFMAIYMGSGSYGGIFPTTPCRNISGTGNVSFMVCNEGSNACGAHTVSCFVLYRHN